MTATDNRGEDLIDTIGGPETVKLIVGALYFHITSDPRLERFFGEAPIERILAHQRAFLETALTGRPAYSGRSLSDAHARLIEERGLVEAHFDIVMAHLRATLTELGIDAGAAQRIEARVEGTRSMIFGSRPDHP